MSNEKLVRCEICGAEYYECHDNCNGCIANNGFCDAKQHREIAGEL